MHASMMPASHLTVYVGSYSIITMIDYAGCRRFSVQKEVQNSLGTYIQSMLMQKFRGSYLYLLLVNGAMNVERV